MLETTVPCTSGCFPSPVSPLLEIAATLRLARACLHSVRVAHFLALCKGPDCHQVLIRVCNVLCLVASTQLFSPFLSFSPLKHRLNALFNLNPVAHVGTQLTKCIHRPGLHTSVCLLKRATNAALPRPTTSSECKNLTAT